MQALDLGRAGTHGDRRPLPSNTRAFGLDEQQELDPIVQATFQDLQWSFLRHGLRCDGDPDASPNRRAVLLLAFGRTFRSSGSIWSMTRHS